jgi:hypothetical protein
MNNYTIDPKVYQLVLRLKPKERAEFLADLLKLLKESK